MIGIYKITNKINNKCYIGQSVNIKRRWYEHKHKSFNSLASCYKTPLARAIRKYGVDNFNWEVIEECLFSQLDEKEKYWIKYYNSCNKKIGYNILTGGSVGYQSMRSFSICQYNLEGKFIKEFNSANEAARELKIINGQALIGRCCKHKCQSAYNFIWRYKEDKTDLFNYNKNIQEKKIYQYDLKGEYLSKYNSVNEASYKIGVSCSVISSALHNSTPTAGGYQWTLRYHKKIKPYIPYDHHNCSVAQFDLKNNLISTYNSPIDASRITRISSKNINKVLTGNGKTAGGFIWKYLE